MALSIDSISAAVLINSSFLSSGLPNKETANPPRFISLLYPCFQICFITFATAFHQKHLKLISIIQLLYS